MEEKEYNVITLENNVEYTEIDKINYNNNTYIYLSNIDNPEDFCIRKIVKENDEEYIVGINSNKEIDKVLELFMKKYTD